MRRIMKKMMAVAAATTLSIGLTACSSTRGGDDAEGTSEGDSNPGGLVGVSMPTKSLERWNRDGAHLKENLETDGYNVSLQYADNKVEQQISQIQNMINEDPDVLVVASIDGSALGPVLDQAKAQGITVFAYDRLILDTESVDYYATFDNYQVGQLQGQYIESTLGLDEGEEGPFNFEPFSGSPDDNNARFFFEGAWDVLEPYMESGVLEVPSGKDPKSVDDWQSIGIQAWMAPAAQSEMETRLNSFYQDKKVDAVLAPNDALALGISQALESDGYGEDDWPVLTGQDADQSSVQNIIAGKQTMTVWKDTRALGDQVAKMVDQIIKGEEVEVNDTESYDNGKIVVPSYLLTPIVITQDNVESELVDSGFYSAEDLGL